MLDFYTKRQKKWVWYSLITLAIIAPFVWLTLNWVFCLVFIVLDLNTMYVLIKADEKDMKKEETKQ